MPNTINISIAKHAILRYNILRMAIFNHLQISKFTVYSFLRGKHIAHLDINSTTLFFCNKICFIY